MNDVHQALRAPGSLGRRRARRRNGGWWVLALSCVVIAITAPVPYLTRSLSELAESSTGLADHYVNQRAVFRAALIIHASSSGLALLLTPVQASALVRRRWVAVHRIIGRVSLAAILVGSLSGLVVAQVSYAGLIGTLGFSSLAIVWAWCAIRAVSAARHGNLDAHRSWATRTIALTLAGVTLRAWMMVFVVLQRPATDEAVQLAFDRAYPIVPFLCWVPNLAIAEWTIRRRRSRTSSEN